MSGNSDHILVNHAALDQAANELSIAVKQTEGIINELESQLKPLAEQWKGTAKQAYDTAMVTWNQAMQHLKDIATQTHVAVSQANTDYSDVDKKAAGMFNDMSIG